MPNEREDNREDNRDGDGTDPTAPTPSSPPRARRPRRWWQRIVLGTLALLVGGVTFVVMTGERFVRARAEAQLAERWGASVEIDDVAIDWMNLRIHMRGIRFDDGVRVEVHVDHVEIQLAWSDLLGPDRQPDVIIHRPHVSFEVKPGPEQDTPERGPPQFRSLQILDGSIAMMLETEGGRTSIDLTHIEARVDRRESGSLDLGVEVTASLGEAGRIEARGRTSSQTPAEAWSFRFSVEQFELASLNLVWLDLVEMDVDRGSLSIDGELTRSASRLQGRIRPEFEGLVLLGAGEDALHPMAEALFGHMLMGASSTLPIDRPMTAEHGSSLTELLETDWQAILGDVIWRGYERRLNKLHCCRTEIRGGVKPRFADGLLQLFEVVIHSRTPASPDDPPLIEIQRVDVVFDPTVTVQGAPAYKHVTLLEPTLNFTAEFDNPDNRVQFDESWLDTISAIPFATRDLVVHGGRLNILETGVPEPIIFVDNIELNGGEMARSLHRSGVRGARLVGRGTILDEAKASIHVVYEPRAAIPNIDVDMSVEPMLLTTLAPALQTFAGVDGSGGTVGFSANISARNYGVDALVMPDVHRPKLRSLEGRRLRKFVLDRALRHLKSHAIELHYQMEPEHGVLQEFFPALIKSVFLDR